MNCVDLIESNDVKRHAAIEVGAAHHTAARMVIVCLNSNTWYHKAPHGL